MQAAELRDGDHFATFRRLKLPRLSFEKTT